jgi:hypothetical protein
MGWTNPHRLEVYYLLLFTGPFFRHGISQAGRVEHRMTIPNTPVATIKVTMMVLNNTRGPINCSGLQTVSGGLANNADFEPTISANRRGREPTFTANELRFIATCSQTAM